MFLISLAGGPPLQAQEMDAPRLSLPHREPAAESFASGSPSDDEEALYINLRLWD